MHPREKMILEYIIGYKAAHDGIPPTIREISEAAGISSTSLVSYYLDHLEDANLIHRLGEIGNSRNIAVTGGRWSMG